MIAVAVSINVDWTEALIGIFETAGRFSPHSCFCLMGSRTVTAEFLGGVASEAATRSVDCLVSKDSAIPRSAIHTVVSIMVPMLVSGLYFVTWFIAFTRLNETISYLAKRCILSFMAVSYLSYIAITKTAVNALSCIDVYDSLELGSNATHAYWAVDTSLRCYEGSHAVLAGLIGWPVLIIFSFGFPAAVAALLVLERKRHNMESEWLFEATGFMYRAYQTKYVYWESVIMLRKAILAVVVVFSYALGGNLQGVLGVCVLMFALYFQIVCEPFRSEFAALNEYEGLSLLICSLTFVSGLFFNDDRTSDAVRVLLTIFLLFANLGIVGFFGIIFFKAAAEYLRTILEAENIDYDPEKGFFHVIKVYVRSRCPRALDRLLNRMMGHPVPTAPDNTGRA